MGFSTFIRKLVLIILGTGPLYASLPLEDTLYPLSNKSSGNFNQKITFPRMIALSAQNKAPLTKSEESICDESELSFLHDIYNKLPLLPLSSYKKNQKHHFDTYPPRGKANYMKKKGSKIIKINAAQLLRYETREFTEGEKWQNVSPRSFNTEQFCPRQFFHAHNMHVKQIELLLPWLKEQGYTHVLTSPLQASAGYTLDNQQMSESEKWWLRYQPIGFQIGNCLGTKEEIKHFLNKAQECNVGVWTDFVGNHLGGLLGLNHLQWEKAFEDPFLYRTTLLRLRCYEEFSMNKTLCQTDKNWENLFIAGDQEALQRCMEDFYDWCVFSHDGQKHYPWFMNALPKLKATENVRHSQRHYLQELIDLGIKGFRIDAADHLDSGLFAEITSFLNQAKIPYFFEIASGDIHDHERFFELAPTTHYPFLHKLTEIFSCGGSLQGLINTGYNINKYIKFAETHDTRASRKNSEQGINAGIKDKRDCELATCYLNAQAGGSVLILNEDAYVEEILASVKFRHLLAHYERSYKNHIKHHEYIYTLWTISDRDNLLFMARADGAGIFILNKSEEIYEMEWDEVPGQKGKSFMTDYLEIAVRQKKTLMPAVYQGDEELISTFQKEAYFKEIKGKPLKIEKRSAQFFVLTTLTQPEKKKLSKSAHVPLMSNPPNESLM